MTKVKVNCVDLEKVKKAFIDMDNEKGILGLSLMEEIIFQKRTLAKMREQLDNDSITSEYNGYQRSNPIIAGYNAMINNYSKLVRQVVELLPDNIEVEMSAEELINAEF